MKKTITLTVAAVALAGCATHPRNIAPAAVSTLQFRDLSCRELRSELRVATAQRDANINRQKGNRTRDGLLNALVIPGLGAVTGDHEDEVAQGKGMVLALENEIAERCADE